MAFGDLPDNRYSLRFYETGAATANFGDNEFEFVHPDPAKTFTVWCKSIRIEASGGDVEMLLYSQGGTRPSLQIMIHHDDAAREYAYTEEDNGSLNAAKQNGWLIVSMKNDWRTILRARPR